ncbi:hypothetical protein D3C86_2057110 [compost metagenome]
MPLAHLEVLPWLSQTRTCQVYFESDTKGVPAYLLKMEASEATFPEDQTVFPPSLT